MSEHVERLRAVIQELENELSSLESLDEETRNALEGTVGEIQATLQRPGPSPVDGGAIQNRLQDSLQEFGASHPALASMLSRVIDTLGQIGI